MTKASFTDMQMISSTPWARSSGASCKNRSTVKLPTVKQLRYFVALEEHRHFGNAAAACFVSQSAFSVAIKEFELLLGVRLVDRTNRKVTVSQLGHEVGTQARLCIRDLESLVEIAGGCREALAGPLRLGVIPTIAPFCSTWPKDRQFFPAPG
jgi:LysR family hydrogen peroxide-inducible transcriptional activator